MHVRRHRHRTSTGFTTSVAAALVAVFLLGSMSPAYADSRDEQRRADRLHQQATQTAQQLHANRARLADLSRQANAALDRYRQARYDQQAAEEKAAHAQRDLAAATRAVEVQRLALGGYAATAYRSGGTEDLSVFAQLVTTSAPDTLIQSVGLLQRVGDQQAQVLLRFRVAAHQQAEARVLAASTVKIAKAKAAQAATAKIAVDRLVAQQQSVVTALRGQLDRTIGAERAARARAAKLKHAEALARQRYGPIGSCRGGDVSGYSNGHLPESALCPLWGAPGKKLRADAAAAFNRMSRSYAGDFGAPICVTSAYRSYNEQAAVYSDKPGLAAPPGRSNHGWGLAADLCGGIQNDGTSSNDWMRANAGRFNWFHPSWAEPGGSGPYEPWHWEFAG